MTGFNQRENGIRKGTVRIAAALALAATGASGWTLDDLEAKFTFTPYDKMPESAPLSYVPTGCPEFTVERPRRTDGPVVKAVDFGLSEGRTDNGEAINRAIAEAKRVGASRLELAPGTYRCYGAKGIVLESLRDFTFDGKGALLVFQRPSRIRPEVPQFAIEQDGGNVSVSNCHRTVIGNFKMDWAWDLDPLADFARVVATHVDEADNASYFDLRLTDLERHPKYPESVPVLIVGKMREDRTNIAGHGWSCGAGYAEGNFGSKNEWIAPNVLRVWPCVKQPGANELKWYEKLFNARRNRNEVKGFKAGELVRIIHYYYGQNGFNFTSNSHLTVEDVEIWACRGLGFQVKGTQHHWQVLRSSVALPEHLKGKRAITATADANHIVQSRGWCKFEDCRFALHIDDMNNFHDRLTVGKKAGPNRILIYNVRGNAFFGAKVGDSVGLLEADYSPLAWTGRVTAIEGDTLVFDREVPKERTECLQLFKSDFATDNIIFRRCDFSDGFGRNLLQSRNMTIEDCTFRHTTGLPVGLIAEWTYTAWCEGCGVTNVVLRNCTFDSNYGWNGGYRGLKAEIFTGARPRAPAELAATVMLKSEVRDFVEARIAEKTLPEPCRKAVSGILVEKCRFLNPMGLVWHALPGDDLVFRDNEIVLDRDETALGPMPYRGSCLFESKEGVFASGNRFTSKLPGVPKGGIYVK